MRVERVELSLHHLFHLHRPHATAPGEARRRSCFFRHLVADMVSRLLVADMVSRIVPTREQGD
jgi:hypothetical protein